MFRVIRFTAGAGAGIAGITIITLTRPLSVLGQGPEGQRTFAWMPLRPWNYTRQTSALRDTVDMLLHDGSRSSWVRLLSPPAGPRSHRDLQPSRRKSVARALRPGPLDPKFEFGRWLVTAPGPGPAARGREAGHGNGLGPWHSHSSIFS